MDNNNDDLEEPFFAQNAMTLPRLLHEFRFDKLKGNAVSISIVPCVDRSSTWVGIMTCSNGRHYVFSFDSTFGIGSQSPLTPFHTQFSGPRLYYAHPHLLAFRTDQHELCLAHQQQERWTILSMDQGSRIWLSNINGWFHGWRPYCIKD